MPCRVGITSDAAARKREWLKQYPNLRHWTILVRNLTYKEAQEREKKEAMNLGCKAESGGAHKPGRVWVVYYFQH